MRSLEINFQFGVMILKYKFRAKNSHHFFGTKLWKYRKFLVEVNTVTVVSYNYGFLEEKLAINISKLVYLPTRVSHTCKHYKAKKNLVGMSEFFIIQYRKVSIATAATCNRQDALRRNSNKSILQFFQKRTGLFCDFFFSFSSYFSLKNNQKP